MTVLRTSLGTLRRVFDSAAIESSILLPLKRPPKFLAPDNTSRKTAGLSALGANRLKAVAFNYHALETGTDSFKLVRASALPPDVRRRLCRAVKSD